MNILENMIISIIQK